MTQPFNTSCQERLQYFLNQNQIHINPERLTPDASTREFFRIKYNNKNAVACVYPERFDKTLHQIDVTNLFIQSDLPVAKIYKVDFELGLLVHEDFGNNILRDFLENAESNMQQNLFSDAVSLIAQIQQATPKAFELNSIASKLKFDREKLLWELNFFKTHYFENLIKTTLTNDLNNALISEFDELATELETFAAVLTHRDFHTANLMLDEDNNLLIIDHQDARIGSVAYDLVSLLLDRVTNTPSETFLQKHKKLLLTKREDLGLEKISFEELDYEFNLTAVQRCLKAIGTFSNQAANFEKTHYTQYINPMFKIVLDICKSLSKYPTLQDILSNEKYMMNS